MENPTVNFFSELAGRYSNENDLSNITVALCNADAWFREKFLYFFFKNININDVVSVRREVRDINDAGSRVDIYIEMTNDDNYIIEVKIGDRNHHFGQYDEAYSVDRNQFGYITNYFCPEGKFNNYISKTWEEFYLYLQNRVTENALVKGYLEYLKYVCHINIYTDNMNFSSLKTIPHFFHTMEKIVEKKSLELNVGPHNGPKNEKMTDIDWAWRYFDINTKDNKTCLLYGIFLLTYYEKTTISIGISNGTTAPLKTIEKELSNQQFSLSKSPYIDKEWLSYLWFDLKEDQLEKLNNLSSVEAQEELLTLFFEEVVTAVRQYVG